MATLRQSNSRLCLMKLLYCLHSMARTLSIDSIVLDDRCEGTIKAVKVAQSLAQFVTTETYSPTCTCDAFDQQYLQPSFYSSMCLHRQNCTLDSVVGTIPVGNSVTSVTHCPGGRTCDVPTTDSCNFLMASWFRYPSLATVSPLLHFCALPSLDLAICPESSFVVSYLGNLVACP